MKWGYVLEAPGRPTRERQLELLRLCGVDVDNEYPPVFSDRIAAGNTNPRKMLEGRNVLLLGVGKGNTVFVANYFCLGFSGPDATWFATEIHKAGGKLCVGGDHIGADDIPAMAKKVTNAQNTHHVRVSRGVEPKYLPGVKPPKRKVGKPLKPAKRPCVYRHYDAEDRLLYVGACANYERRMGVHKSKKAPWLPQIARASVEFYSSMKEALKAENEAIWFEKPVHNVRRTMPDTKAFIKRAAKLAEMADPELAKQIREMQKAI